jgi:hypothetical protein
MITAKGFYHLCHLFYHPLTKNLPTIAALYQTALRLPAIVRNQKSATIDFTFVRVVV